LKQYRPHILVVIALLIVLLSGWHGALRNALTDLRFNWLPGKASGEIVVIAIDATSIEKIGVWPWPRRLHAELLRQLEKAGARDIAFDVDFSTPSDPASDKEFLDALADLGGSVILPAFKQPGSNPAAVHINRPLKPFADHSWSAIVNVAVEPDGLVRRYPFGERLDAEYLPSMAAVFTGQYSESGVPFLIDFGISAASIPRVSYIDVLRGDPVTLEKLKDKQIIIGGTALELGDRFSVPNGNIVSGPILQALAAESIQQNRALRGTSEAVALAGLWLVSLIMVVTWRRLGAGGRVVLLAAVAGAAETIAILLQAEMPLVLDTSLLHTAIAVYLAAIALDEIDFRDLLSRVAENRFQRIAMSLGDGLICADSNYQITVWNPGATSIFGYEPAEMIGRPIDDICAGYADGASPGFSIRDAIGPGSLAHGVTEFEGRRKNGEVFAVEACFSGWQGTDGFQFGAVLRDISARKREAERVQYLAEYDTLTGLANRNTLHTRLEAMIGAAGKQSDTVVLLVLGLDGFQQINDMLGHAYGDLVLRAAAERLNFEAGDKAIVARLSGDEFAIAIPCAALAETVAQFCGRIADAFDHPLSAGTRQQRVKVSIGAAVHPGAGRAADELLSNSHLAFCRAKATRRGGHIMFENAIRHEIEARLTLEAELALAIEHDQFELFYQPQVRLTDGAVIGAEALIRWRHPDRGLVAPGHFMPVVNTCSLSDRIARWVLETACKQARAWELAGNGVRTSVNLSPSQLQSGDLAATIREVLDDTGLAPPLLELEVTEDILLLDEHRVLDTFLRIRDLGVRIVFDDFGTGYASLSYLKKFPLDGLKIDRSFVRELLTNSDDAAIVGSTVGLGRRLNISVIAEGIEDRATADLLVAMGCEEGQGYFFGRPMSAQAFEKQFWIADEVAVEADGAGKAA
jgi:diguanylate cyclase (GGDEF)-like protein/PAS domain S-box-containing protein